MAVAAVAAARRPERSAAPSEPGSRIPERTRRPPRPLPALGLAGAAPPRPAPRCPAHCPRPPPPRAPRSRPLPCAPRPRPGPRLAPRAPTCPARRAESGARRGCGGRRGVRAPRGGHGVRRRRAGWRWTRQSSGRTRRTAPGSALWKMNRAGRKLGAGSGVRDARQGSRPGAPSWKPPGVAKLLLGIPSREGFVISSRRRLGFGGLTPRCPSSASARPRPAHVRLFPTLVQGVRGFFALTGLGRTPPTLSSAPRDPPTGPHSPLKGPIWPACCGRSPPRHRDPACS